jgi:osmoprotectant transport system substrate-binding protein
VRTSHGILAAVAASVMVLSACSTATPSTPASPTGGTATAAACVPVAGDQLVVLADDMHLQTVDNIIPAVNADSAKDPAVLAALDAVSGALTTAKLVDLNKATDVDFNSSADAAAAFVSSEGVTAPQKGTGSLTVGAANFSENITVAEIYAAVLRDAGYAVDVRTIGNRETYMPALMSGEVDIVPEYVGTVTEFLNKQINGADAAPLASGDLDATAAKLAALASQKGLAFGTPSSAQDQNAFAVTQAFADAHGLTTLSDLARACGTISLGGPAECPDRPFCQPGLESTYGLKFGEFQSLDAGGPLTKAAIRKGDVVLGLVFSSDGTLG